MNDDAFTSDALWRTRAFRLACAALDDAWQDACIAERHRLTRTSAAQLYAAVASVGANIAEGYSRGSGRDRARFFEYALGSARESMVWYRAIARVLQSDTVTQRLARLIEIRRLLLVIIPAERRRTSLRARSTTAPGNSAVRTPQS